MIAAWRAFGTFSAPARLLMVNQFGINLGFYMLMPFLAEHLSSGLGLPAAVAGLILGVRNLSQQGMFFAGGALSDRFGAKALIVAGLLLRTGGFTALGLASGTGWLIAGAGATGLAGALFNPAVRAYLAEEAAVRRVEAFAVFNVCYQAGILLGPLAGLALLSFDFAAVCLTAAVIFAVLAAAQMVALPARAPAAAGKAPWRAWKHLVTDRRFLRFSAAMSVTYLLSFQVYLVLPLTLRAADPSGGRWTAIATGIMFTGGALLTIGAQVRLSAWCQRHWSAQQTLARGATVMAVAFLPPLAVVAYPAATVAGYALTAAPVIVAGLLITSATMITFPQEMDIVSRLAGPGLSGTCYGLYSTAAGLAITAGNLGTGALLQTGTRWLPWAALAAAGGLAAVMLARLTLPAAVGTQPAPVPTNDEPREAAATR